jgi:signal transduction histidine kinase
VLLLLTAVVVSTWFGGLGPGLLATLLSGAIIDYYLEAPPYRWEVSEVGTVVDVVGFVLVAVFLSWLHARLRTARQRAETARAAAEAAARARDELLAVVSHDLKNPLTTLTAWTGVLQRGVAELSPEDAEGLAVPLEHLDRSTTRMRALVDELLDGAQLDLGRPLPLLRRPTDLVTLAQQAATDYAEVTPRHCIRVEASVPSLPGHWDGARLERVVTNLLSNAVKYSPRGGDIRLSLGREETAGGPLGVLAVQDHGLGIPAAEVSRLFEGYYRGRNVAGRIGGTGLGLATARQVVHQHGGTISVESAEGVGTTVIVRLPLAPEASRAA